MDFNITIGIIVFLVLFVALFPIMKTYIKNKKVQILLDLVEKAVKFAKERFWDKAGEEKRTAALLFVKEQLKYFNITFDEQTIQKYLDYAVQEFIREE